MTKPKNAGAKKQKGGMCGDAPARLYHQVELFERTLKRLMAAAEAIVAIGHAMQGESQHSDGLSWAADQLVEDVGDVQESFEGLQELIEACAPGVKVEADRVAAFMAQTLNRPHKPAEA